MPRPFDVNKDQATITWLRLKLESAREPIRTIQALSRLQEQMDNDCEDAADRKQTKPESISNPYFRGAIRDAIRVLADVAVQDLDQLDGEIGKWTTQEPPVRAA